MRKYLYAIIALLLLAGLVSCDRSTPPGVNEEEVSKVPLNPNFNAHIRPLLWKLANQANQKDAQFWKTIKKDGLPLEELKKHISAKRLGGLNTPKELTLIWRWSKDGGSVNVPKWLSSPLPKPSSSLKSVKVTEGDLEKLGNYWLNNFTKNEDHVSPFRSFLKDQICTNTPYDEILKKIYSLPDSKANSETHISSHILATSPSYTLAHILGIPSRDLPEHLFSEFSQKERTLLYTEETDAQIRSLKAELSTQAQHLNELKASPTHFNNWKSKDAGYIPLSPADFHYSYNEASSAGYYKGGKTLTNTEENISQLTVPTTAISYWIKGDGEIKLSGTEGGINIISSSSQITLRKTLQEKSLEIFTTSTPIIGEQWNHILLTLDQSNTQGFSLFLNGQLINPARDLHCIPPASPLTISARGNGVLDEVKVFTNQYLSPLECATLYNYKVPNDALLKNDLPYLVSHFNYKENAEFKKQLVDTAHLHSRCNSLVNSGKIETVLPSRIKFKLSTGSYLKETTPLIIINGELSELTSWLAKDASPWLARATVNWVYSAYTGQPLTNMIHPEETIPENWEKIDLWASSLIENGWDLKMLLEQIKTN